MDQSHQFRPDPAASAARSQLLSRRVRLRARLDAAAVAVATAGAAALGDTAEMAMMAALAALSLGILAYVIRRDRDFSRFAAHERWRERALDGKGVSLSDWKAGATPQPWPRRDSGQD